MAQITVSGHLFDPSGAATAGSVSFQLANFGANIPRVIGTNAIVATFITFTANASGFWTGSIQGNDTIDPGSTQSPPTTYYIVSFRDTANNVIRALPFQFTGAGPANLDSQGPMNSVPLPFTPPNNAALLAANQTFTGNNTFQGTTTLGTVAGNVAFTGSPTISGTLNVTGLLEAQAGISVDGTHTELIPANSSTLVDLSASQTLTNKTLTSPVINGTPSGTGIPTISSKTGSKAADYTTTSATFVNVDGTNLLLTITIPTGWKMTVLASGNVSVSNTAINAFIAINDSVSGIISRIGQILASTTVVSGWAVNGEINGDGASHTISLQYASDGVNTLTIKNSANNFATMVLIMTPSN